MPGKGSGRTDRAAPTTTKPFVHSLGWQRVDYDEDSYNSDAEDEWDERCENLGFTHSELNELLCQGVKPWDDDAWDVLAALSDY